MIREVTEEDIDAIVDIYNHYILNSVTTFAEERISKTDFIETLKIIHSSGFSALVGLDNKKVIGYAYSSEWNHRSAYRSTAEVSIYLLPASKSKGWGTKLYSALFTHLRDRCIHTVIAGITIPNDESVALHEKFGMKKVAHFSEVGFKFGQWLDVGYWQVQLDKVVNL